MYPWMLPYAMPTQPNDPIAQTKAFFDFFNEWNEKNKKKDEKKDDKKPRMGMMESMLFLMFVMPILGIFISAAQFYVFSTIFASALHLR